MSFTVTQVNPPATNAQSPEGKAASTRERAMQAFMGKAEAPAPAQVQVQELPVDPNHVDPSALAQLNQAGISAEQPPKEATPALPAIEEPKVPSPKEDPALSSQYAALARREKALRSQKLQQDQAFRDREVQLKAREEALKPSSTPSFDASKYVSTEDLRKDPFSALANLGLTYEQLTEMAINAPKPDEVRLQQLQATYDAKIKALEDKLEGTNKTIKEQETNAYQGAINQIRADVKALINKDPAFETIKVTGQSEEVVKLIESVYKDGMGEDYPKGTVLDHYEAAKMVEDEIAENLYQWTSKASKVNSRFKPAAPVAPTPPATKTQTSQTSSSVQMKTLTNQMNASRQISARDRAILAAEGKLGK